MDCRAVILQGNVPDYTCLLGAMAQEVYDTHPAVRGACDRCISAHAADIA